MAWDQLSINRPHLAYIILGGFTTIFMLVSSVIKERLYIGEATVATICGIIFGPHAANLIDPATWGNVDQITLEFSRIVLVVQCFAVGVELPKYYMERHWKSVVLLLVPVMTFGWLITSLFIWALFNSHLNWLDSLVVAACVTATDPVLASSVVGKGKFAKRVPKHLRDLLSAESGCNDGMAFPFIYLGIYITKYKDHPSEIALHWFCNTILYECVWGAVYGVLVGYMARRAIRYAHEKDWIDRESFLVFYFVLALFCAGSGSLLGMDDLLVGFACGVGFSNDGWFLEKTEESHVSNVIDLLINLAFFVYFGTIIPWDLYNSDIIGITPWKLVVLGILVLLFRRIPIMLALKPLIPDVKTWREASFAGHFGPIGVGALFVAILARAEFETDTTTPLAELPPRDYPHANIIELIWPITTFLVICSIIVHGSSIAVFTLGKHINTLTITMSYTQGNDNNNWMDRLPRIQSRSKSQARNDSDLEEKMPDYPASVMPRDFLRRRRDDDSSARGLVSERKRRWDAGIGPGGRIEQSAIGPRPVSDSSPEKSFTDSTGVSSPSPPNEESDGKLGRKASPRTEVYQEGHHTIVEDQDGNVLSVTTEPGVARDENSGESEKPDAISRQETVPADERRKRSFGLGVLSKLSTTNREKATQQPKPENRHRPARAFRIGNTVIVEDEDGEVIKKYDLPTASERKASTAGTELTRQRLQRMSKYLGMGEREGDATERRGSEAEQSENDDGIRFTVEGQTRRLSKADFLRQLQELDPRMRASVAEDSNAPEAVKAMAREDAGGKTDNSPGLAAIAEGGEPALQKMDTNEAEEDIPVHNISRDLKLASGRGETAAERRRRLAATAPVPERRLDSDGDSDDDGTERVPPHRGSGAGPSASADDGEQETAAERRRREAALGLGSSTQRRADDSSSDEDEPTQRQPLPKPHEDEPEPAKRPGIRFSESTRTLPKAKEAPAPSPSFGSIRWGQDRGRDRERDTDGGEAPKQTRRPW